MAPGFAGNNVEAIWEKLTKIHSADAKDEFETTEEFHRRVDRESGLPLMGSLTQKSTLAFVIPLVKEVGGAQDISYNADAEIMRMRIRRIFQRLPAHTGPRTQEEITVESTVLSKVPGVGENAFGAKTPITIEDDMSYMLTFANWPHYAPPKGSSKYLWPADTDALLAFIHVERGEAQGIMDSARGLVICRVVAPFASQDVYSHQATTDEPTEWQSTVRRVYTEVLGVWFFDSHSGRILAKVI